MAKGEITRRAGGEGKGKRGAGDDGAGGEAGEGAA
jgi:hypothetical protein